MKRRAARSPRRGDRLVAAASLRSEPVMFALRHETSLLKAWDLVLADEAHRLRNYWTGKTKAAEAVAHIVSGAHETPARKLARQAADTMADHHIDHRIFTNPKLLKS